jgi:hypothetical protein
MARTINEISAGITAKLQMQFALSASAVAEWKLWVSACATAIHVFELILDAFKKDVEQNVMTSRPGTRKWFERLCFLFQNGHNLIWDEQDGTLKYAVDDPEARITAVANVKVRHTGEIVIRVAKIGQDGNLVPFADGERQNFTAYMNDSKPIGMLTTVLSTTPDLLIYEANIYYDPSYAAEQVDANVLSSINEFRLSQKFGGILYRQQFIEAIMLAEGVITVHLDLLAVKGASDENFVDALQKTELEAGYFTYHEDCSFGYISADQLEADFPED